MITEKEHEQLFMAKAVWETVILDMKMNYVLYNDDWKFWEGTRIKPIPFGKSAIETYKNKSN